MVAARYKLLAKAVIPGIAFLKKLQLVVESLCYACVSVRPQ